MADYFDPGTGEYRRFDPGEAPPPGWKRLRLAPPPPGPVGATVSYTPGKEPTLWVDPETGEQSWVGFGEEPPEGWKRLTLGFGAAGSAKPEPEGERPEGEASEVEAGLGPPPWQGPPGATVSYPPGREPTLWFDPKTGEQRWIPFGTEPPKGWKRRAPSLDGEPSGKRVGDALRRPAVLVVAGVLAIGLVAGGIALVSGSSDSGTKSKAGGSTSAGAGTGISVSKPTEGRLAAQSTQVRYQKQGATYWTGDLIAAPPFSVSGGTLYLNTVSVGFDQVARNADQPVDVTSSEDPCKIPDVPPRCDAWKYPDQNIVEMRASFDLGDPVVSARQDETTASWLFKIPAGAARLVGLEVKFDDGVINWFPDQKGFLTSTSQPVTLTWSPVVANG